MEPTREAMLRLRGRRRVAKAHWTEMDDRERRVAAETVAALGGLQLVAVGSPVPVRRQERARRKCLASMVTELYGFGVTRLFMESREAELNARDVRTVQQARFALPKDSAFWVEHLPGGSEPLLWVADIVAGACRAEQLGRSMYRKILGETVLDYRVDTGCN